MVLCWLAGWLGDRLGRCFAFRVSPGLSILLQGKVLHSCFCTQALLPELLLCASLHKVA